MFRHTVLCLFDLSGYKVASGVLLQEKKSFAIYMGDQLSLAILQPILEIGYQPVLAASHPPRVWFCLSFLAVKGEFFLATVPWCLLLMGLGGILGLHK